MTTLRPLLLLPLCALVAAPLHAAPTTTTNNSKSKTVPLSERPYADVKNLVLRKELQALDEAANLLAEVNDEKSAKQAHSKIDRLFRMLPPITGGSAQELDLLARAQNKVSSQMWRLMEEEYFEKAQLQESWTLMTDHFSRPSAAK